MSTSGSGSSPSSFPGSSGPVVGQDFAQFHILDTIGAGGMGAVFRAFDRESGSEVALKILRSAKSDAKLRIRFEREAEALRQLDHKNIVKVGSSGVEGEICFFSMELLRGQSLQQQLITTLRDDDGQPQLSDILSIFSDVASALSYAHSKRLAHRDIKPENIVIEEGSQRPVLVDFGLIRKTDGGGEQLTQSSEILGTPHYMSPEQVGIFPEKKPITVKTDVWSFGVTLFNALTGKTPYSGETTYNIFTAMVQSEPKRLSDFDPSLPIWLEELCADCLQKDPDKRPDMAELVERLNEGREELESQSSPWARRALSAFTLFAVLLPLGLYFWLAQKEELRLKLAHSGPLYVNKKIVAVKGWASPLGSKLTFNGREPWRVEKAGPFEKEVTLRDGEPSLEVTLQYGSQRVSQSVPIVFDTTPPQLTLSNTLGTKLRILKSRVLRGAVRDKNLVLKMRVGGETVELSPGGQFSIEIGSLKKMAVVEFRMVDKAGNIAIERVNLISSAAFRAVQKRLLSSRKQWSEADPVLTDLVIAKMSRRLSKNFEYLQTRLFQCGKLSHRIALFRHKKTGIEFCLLPGGTYIMGRKKEDSPFGKKMTSKDVFQDSWDFALLPTPPHRVRIPPLLISRFEVSRAQWLAAKGEELDSAKINQKNHPMQDVSWEAVKAWLKDIGEGFRLPSESEWEYACRAGSTTKYYWGDVFDSRYALVRDSKDTPGLEDISAREKFANAFGLVNMIGGVWEWCEDHFEVNYLRHPHNERPMLNVSGLNNKVIRGHSNTSFYTVAQTAERMRAHPEKSFFDVGFRVAVSLPP